MKKILIFLIAISTFVFAGVEAPFVQFAPDAFCEDHFKRTDQNWFGAQLISFEVKAGTNVWLSNYVNTFYNGKLPSLDGTQFSMTGEHKYGYINKKDLSTMNEQNYADAIHWSTGKITSITYTYDADPSIKTTTTGYLLDYFGEDAEIFFVMTTLPQDGGETVDSYQYVQDADHDTTLVSRQHNTVDLAGNVRINFGVDSAGLGLIGREFVAVFDKPSIDGGVSGQPLPGALTSFLLIAASVGLCRLKKREF